MKEKDTEWSGGYIHKECPYCGQFCKIPEFYNAHHIYGAWAKSYCKRCKREVDLSVEFI